MPRNEPPSSPPSSIIEMFERLDSLADSLPKRLRQCASFTRRNMHLIAVSTVSEMATASGVAPSVYLRFAQSLGFSGYSEMQALFREQYTSFRPDYGQRLAQLRPEAARDDVQLLSDFSEAGHKSLITLANTVTSDTLNEVAIRMAEARIVHLIGVKRAFSVVSNLSYLLGKMEVPAMLHSDVGSLDMRHLVGPEDVVFAVTFAPFSAQTVQLARDASERGATVFGLTDSEDCPLSVFAADLLFAREDEVAGFRSLTASITLTTTLAVLVGARREKRLTEMPTHQ
ncbi:transcriptional regulator, RpiR family [Poseidonocella pacifica]|uniref:Transcriptional regulator, RpiR family n=1 Tax=Poseidonocella pacifica TaxID=871651 RepID=A0A1I0VXK9_9RHOB|nr:MurR/RpiR family transcriptional regulator [Poseidonocella pacifica]SFA80406.1 transcriptional regulator, RpiR family [Poseidonocella pacifica]